MQQFTWAVAEISVLLVPGTPDIISRNLTPDKTGLPEGGSHNSYEQFVKNHEEPAWIWITSTRHVRGRPLPIASPPPFDGNLLQIMPWPTYSRLTDRDLRGDLRISERGSVRRRSNRPNQRAAQRLPVEPKLISAAGPVLRALRRSASASIS